MNRKLTLFIILLFLTVGNIYGQETCVINFEKVYSFINFLNSTVPDNAVKLNLSDQPVIGMFRDDTTLIFKDSLFDKADIEFFIEQFKILDKVKWQSGKIDGAHLISQKDIKEIYKTKDGWDKFKEKYGGCLTEFSLPIFDKNYDYCIFYTWTQCDGLAGGGGLYLFKFENGKWTFIKSYGEGVS